MREISSAEDPMERFNAQKATALGIGDLAPVGRRRRRKKRKTCLGKVKLGSCRGEREPRPGASLTHSSQLSGPGSQNAPAMGKLLSGSVKTFLG